MLRRTACTLAPPKGHLFQRIISNDFMGINWNKVLWKAPWNNLYPVTLSAGQIGRLWSSPLGFGNHNARMGLIMWRGWMLHIPAMMVGFVMAFQTDWFQLMQCIYYLPGWELPKWAQTKYAEDKRLESWYKPGAYAKHHLGGQISIPGSEKLIKA